MNEIQKYIIDARAQGASDEQIRQSLLQSGWDEQTVANNLPSPASYATASSSSNSQAESFQFTDSPKSNDKKKLIFQAGAMVLFGIIIVVAVFMFANTSENDGITNLASEEDTGSQSQNNEPDSLNRPSRDTFRKNHMGMLASSLEVYAAENSGSYPGFDEISAVTEEQLTDDDGFIDPSSNQRYEFVESEPSLGQIQYRLGSRCSDTSNLTEAPGARRFALRTALEAGDFYCIDNF